MAIQLRPRVALLSALVALPAALLLLWAIDSIRTRDLSIALERFVNSQLNDQVKERCESDPTWFLAGPFTGRPKGGQPPVNPTAPDSDVLAPRPKIDEQPFELFAYDEDFLGSSTATPRFPNELRLALRRSSASVIEPFATKTGTGLQMATWTGWITGPCAVLLGRMRPVPNALLQQFEIFAGLFVVCYAVAMLAVLPTVMRVRRLARDARQAAAEQHASIAPDRQRDEISSVAFIYNDTAKALHERAAVSKDREEALRRFIEDTSRIGQPLGDLTARLGALERRGAVATDARAELRQASREGHDLSSRLANLSLAAELHARRTAPAREPFDFGALVTRVAAQLDPLARSFDVTVDTHVPESPLQVAANSAMLAQAVANIVDNAIRYNRPGGHVSVVLTTMGDEAFSLRVRDNGTGVSDEEFKSLTAIRRFRGDEGRERRPGVPGLGLGVAREVVERLGWKLDLGRPSAGGFEVDVSGATTSPVPSAGPR